MVIVVSFKLPQCIKGKVNGELIIKLIYQRSAYSDETTEKKSGFKEWKEP